ncbi:hypothetical protein NFI96_000145, partial [Prochilodus magdalenae]
GAFSRISDRFFRTHDRRRGSSLLLLAPLLAEADPTLASSRPPGSTGAAGLHSRFHWIADHVPAFKVPGGRIRVLHSPDEFYQAMKFVPDHESQARIKTAKKRVVMASLYLGTGPLEQDLVDCMEEALKRSQENPAADLKVSILLDYTRGSRGKKNSRTMLLPLLQHFPEQMRVCLYHTPDLRGLLRLLVPERFNETIGVQHIKAYLFDDSLIISGANLSDSYFTNRQDRYVLLEDCREVADFFAELVRAVGDVSLQLEADDTVHMKEGMVHPYKGKWPIIPVISEAVRYIAIQRHESSPSTKLELDDPLRNPSAESALRWPCSTSNRILLPVGNRFEFSASARRQIMEVMNPKRTQQHALDLVCSPDSDLELECGEERRDTWVFPLVQMKPLGIRLDEEVTQRLLREAGGDTVYLTSGYFNLTRTYMKLVLGTATGYRILMASPEVNGFFGAKGVAGAIPEAYIHLAHQFYRKVCDLGQQGRVHLHEYHRPDWTFHAKGLWYYLEGEDHPCLTLIGSPNFGYRSVHRDLEAQIAIVTENKELQAQLQQARTPGDVEEAVGGQQPSSRRSTARALQNVLQQATNVHVSAQTVRIRLHEDGMRARRPQMGVVLTAQHRAGCLAFAREHQDWQIRHWRPVLFTDESRFTLSTCDRRDRVWRRRGERSAACNILQHDRFGISLEGLHVLARGSLTAMRSSDPLPGSFGLGT